MIEHLETKAAFTVSEIGEIEGLAWLFNSPDSYGDEITKQAFSETSCPLPMLDTHNQGEAIGVWDTVEATDNGLKVKGRLLVNEIQRAREVRALIREKAVTGLSIGFIIKHADPRKGGGRIISDLSLKEISIVAVPAHPGARITSAKALDARKENILDTKATETETKIDAGLEKKINELAGIIKQIDMSKISKRVDELEAKMQRAGNGKYNDVPDEETLLEKKAFGTYLRHGKEGLSDLEKKALTVGDSAQAGYLAPPEFGDEIIKLLREMSPIRQYANVKTMASAEMRWPRRLESTKAKWVEEIEERSETSLKYEQVAIKPFELATFADISRQLMEDNAYNLEDELKSDLAESFAITEAESFILGSGVKQPMGLLTSPQIKTTNAAAIDGDTLIDLIYSLPTFYSQKGVFVMNRNTIATVRKLKNANGDYIWQESLKEGQPATLLGRPVVEAVDMPDPTAGNTPIIFGDLSGYRIMDRVGFEIFSDPYTQATKGIVRFHARRRVGADVTHPDRIRKLTLTSSK